MLNKYKMGWVERMFRERKKCEGYAVFSTRVIISAINGPELRLELAVTS